MNRLSRSLFFKFDQTRVATMDLRDLRLFLHLGQTLHFARTARDCHVSASSLSRSIQRLEQECGEALFERDNRSVSLTRAGLLFRDFAQETLSAWAALQRRLHEQAELLQGSLSVFCSVTASYSFLHALLDEFRSSHPAVEINLHTGDSALAIQRVLDEVDDIGIAARPDRLPQTLVFQNITRSPLVFIGPARKGPLSDTLKRAEHCGEGYPWAELPFIAPESGLVRTRTEEWFRRKALQPRIYARVSGNEAIVSMVSLGFGVAVVPELVVENSPMSRTVRTLPVAPELEPFVIGLCSLRRRQDNPLVRAFRAIASDTRADT